MNCHQFKNKTSLLLLIDQKGIFKYLVSLFRILASLVPLNKLDPVLFTDHNTAASLFNELEYL